METTTILIIAGAVVVIAAIFGVLATRRRRVDQVGVSEYVTALEHMIEGDDEAAVKHLTLAVASDTGNVNAYIRLGNILRRMGHIAQAIKVHRDLTLRKGLSEEHQRMVVEGLAKDFLAAERYELAEETIEKSSRGIRRDPRIMLLLRDACEGQGKWEDAVSAHEELAKVDDTTSPPIDYYVSEIARRMLDEGAEREAEKILKHVLKRVPESVPALVTLGDIHYSQGNTEKAVGEWNRIVDSSPSQGHVVFGRLEKAYFEAGDFGKIQQTYERVLEAKPDDIHALLSVASLHDKRGEYGEAARVARQALEVDPSNCEARLLLTGFLCKEGELDEVTQTVLVDTEPIKRPSYVCRGCGYSTHEIHWQCPRCNRWKSFF
jgi:lipopolysaccharide biosynthesis regulator YciM